MTDRDALLRAILHDPDDDLPRLVYADHLDECEPREPERAEFVRVQVGIGTMLDRPARDAECLWARTAELLGAKGKEWCWEVVPDTANWHPVTDGFLSVAPTVELEFTRGFVRRIECELRWFLAHAPVLFAAQPVERVTISNAVIHPSGGNDTYYVGGLGVFRSEYWHRLEGHRTRSDALSALSAVCVAHGRQLADLPALTEGARTPCG